MNHTIYNFNEKSYQFDTGSFINKFEEYKERKGYRYKTQLYNLINNKFPDITEDVLKKWLSQKSTPNDINTVKRLALFLECDTNELLIENTEKEITKMMNNNFERDAIRKIYESFVELLCAFEDEKTNVSDEELSTAYDNNYKLYSCDEPVRLEECRISYDGAAYVYPLISEKAKEVKKELQISMMDLPAGIIRELDILVYNILNDEVESQFLKDTSEKDFDSHDKEIFGSFKDYKEVRNHNFVSAAKKEYYDKLFNIINPYFAYQLDSKFKVFA